MSFSPLSVVLTLAITFGLASTGLAQNYQPPPPLPAQTQRAKPNDLMKSPPFDRLTVIDNAVFEIEPIVPRPLPPIDPKKLRAAAEQERIEDRARKGDAFNKKPTDETEQMIVIHLMDGEIRDFKIKRSAIKNIEYFEDMLLNEADRLVREGEFTRAFERLQLVKAREPNWKGLDDRVNRLLFEEGSNALIDDSARGLRLLADLNARQPDFPGLADRLAGSYAKRIDRAIEANDFLVARRLVRELDQAAPNHAEARAARAKLVSRTRVLMDQASKGSASDRVDRLTEAIRIWPETNGLESAYREAFRAEPTMNVAVADLAAPIGPFPTTPAAERVTRLLYLPLLASLDESATRGEATGQLLAGMQAVELGKGLKIALKTGPTWSDGSRPVTAIDVARSLADRALPASPGYNARWAALLDRVEVVDETHLDLKLTRSSMKIETWLLAPVGPAHASSDGWVSALGQPRKPVGDGPYRWEPTNDSTTLLHAVGSEAGSSSTRIKRIREIRYLNHNASIEALVRGDLAMIERVPPDRMADLARFPETIRIGRYATPSVHLISLDGRTPALRNRKLRRALSMAINRAGLLEEIVLRRPPDDINRVSDGPFVHGSFVDATGVEPLEYRPLLAKGLVAAARKELGGNAIRLTLEYPAIAEARAVCPKLVEAFGLVGVEVQLIERGESELEDALHHGRRFDMAYRTSRPAQPLHDAGPLLVPGFDAPPSADTLASAASPRILQLLIQLDQAPETTSARGLAQEIDRECRDELPVLPLWQLEDHYAWRSFLKGPAESIENLYDGIANWEIEPWIEKDPS